MPHTFLTPPLLTANAISSEHSCHSLFSGEDRQRIRVGRRMSRKRQRIGQRLRATSTSHAGEPGGKSTLPESPALAAGKLQDPCLHAQPPPSPSPEPGPSERRAKLSPSLPTGSDRGERCRGTVANQPGPTRRQAPGSRENQASHPSPSSHRDALTSLRREATAWHASALRARDASEFVVPP